MRVFLHIGSHKTGTTAIQEFASENGGWLMGQGLLYPSYELIGGTRERSHLGMVNRITRADPLPETESPALLLAKARDMAEADGLDILLSAESLFRLDDTAAKKVTDLLLEVFGAGRCTVVCSLRARAEFAESLYRNHYRAFSKVPEPFSEWLERNHSNFQYATILSRYATPLQAKFHLLPYSKASRDGFVASFFQTLGVNITESAQPPREKNPSLDVVDCLAKQRIMNGSCDAQLSKAFNNFALKNRISSGYGFLDRQQEDAFTRFYAEENQALVAGTPALQAVLGSGVEPMLLAPIDDTCHDMVDARIEAFWASRTARKPKAAPVKA
ncbi:hypothetical protein [Pseudotabrizicola algicola]|uniref:Sulfotransferase family protein n=1 Tax=Pseudotabrizicola algicola TaxID=2709381 RepID=A0A6B3RR39_9RHOB|nr:hypothetical protein [Pseudotabrizicola algicola]NEX47753.1 hypothetical protein [Pseudotabrizicola algicola]